MKQTITIKVNKETLAKMQEFYHDYLVANNGEYVIFCASINNIIITGWDSKKEDHKVTFVGDDPLLEAKIWDKDAKVNQIKEHVKEQWLYFGDQIGSDEVGVGDFFGPMIVVAAFVKESQIKDLIKLGIHDSKKLSDSQILEIGPKVAQMFDYSKLTLSNDKYNQMIAKCENLNSLKAKMHNRALLNMHKEYPDVLNIFVDQFVNETTYYKYLNDENEEQVKGICFRTKGESYYPCVALASVIARYSFLKEMEKLEDHYQMKFPLGAGSKVDEFAKEFMKKFGKEELDKLVKKNFKNYQNL